MADFIIKKGFDIPLSGGPVPERINRVFENELFFLFPSRLDRFKPRLLIADGDSVEEGQAVVENKHNPTFNLCAPRPGTLKSIVYGERRSLDQLIFEPRPGPAAPAAAAIPSTREALIEALQGNGLWQLIRQRPFGRTADPNATPKAVFVNAMNTAPGAPNFNWTVRGQEQQLTAGLELLQQLTEVPLHLCHAPGLLFNAPAFVQTHCFKGPHPAGNPSVHIHRISPLRPGDTVWSVKASDLLLLAEWHETGRLPESRLVALGGPSVKSACRRYYRIPFGTDLTDFFQETLLSGEHRILDGGILSGRDVTAAPATDLTTEFFSVIPEEHDRFLLGWTTPAWNQFSVFRTAASRWLRPTQRWPLGTALHGSRRAMVVTGWYDRFQPLNLLTDYLIRAVLAHDTEEAVQLGILETLPEDFALPAFICPAKTDLCGIIRQGLDEIEKEGL